MSPEATPASRSVTPTRVPIDTGMNTQVTAPVRKNGPARFAQNVPCTGTWALLTADARLTMPAEPAEHRGPREIAGFLLVSHAGLDLKFLPTRANGQPALVLYLRDPSAPVWRASCLVVLTLRGTQIRALTRFGNLGLLARFGFPRLLPG